MSETKEEASLSHYDLWETFTAHEAACLIAGLDPVHWEAKGETYKGPVSAIKEAMARDYERTYNTAQQGAKRCNEAKQPYPNEVWREEGKFLPDEDFWVDWMLLLVNPDAFEPPSHTVDSSIDEVVFRGEDIAAWLRSRQYRHACYFWTDEDREREADAARRSPSPRVDQLPQQDGGDKPLDPRERSTLYKIILTMAMDGYGYAPNDKRSPIPGQVSTATGGLGLLVTDETISRHLRAAAQLLPQKPQEI
ncbi:hypothetical protein [Castellaniella sp.]|uniref:hypothetical protein n=1 Tax=Castellaniella sp. TaxID=1955812 RepID=UPI003A9339A0